MIPNNERLDTNIVVDGNFTAALRGSYSEQSTNTGKLNVRPDEILGSQWRPNARYTVRVVRDNNGDPVNTDSQTGNEIRQNYMIDPVSGDAIATATNNDGAPSVQVKVYRNFTESIPKAVNFNFEDMARPPWMANVFSPKRIGPEYYEKMFGCGSIMDGGIPLFGESTNVEELDTITKEGSSEADPSPFEYISIPFQRVGNYSTPDDILQEQDQKVLIPKDLLTKGSSTQQIADQLAEVWIGLKEMGVDTTRFIELYTERAFADIPGVMGTVNKGLLVEQASDNAAARNAILEVSQTEGFHCWAYGPYTELNKGKGPAWTSDTEKIVSDGERLTTANPASGQRDVDTNIDTRASRYQKVQRYVAELKVQMGDRRGTLHQELPPTSTPSTPSE